jgi:hypothetical protein
VDHVHGLVDRWRSRSTMDHAQRNGQSSLECGFAGAVGLRSLLLLHGEGEEDEGVHTPSGVWRRGDCAGPAVVMDGGGAKSSMGRHLEAQRRNEDNGNGLWRWRPGLGFLL